RHDRNASEGPVDARICCARRDEAPGKIVTFARLRDKARGLAVLLPGFTVKQGRVDVTARKDGKSESFREPRPLRDHRPALAFATRNTVRVSSRFKITFACFSGAADVGARVMARH